MEKDLVSIIVPCYNAAPYLEDFLRAIKNITYPNYEVIFIDDGSTDNTLKLLESFVAVNKKAKIIYKKTMMGVSSARNDGIKIAKGEFIYMPDPDDVFHPNLITVLHHLINKYEADVAACYFGKIGENKRIYKFSNEIKIKKVTVINGLDDVYSKNLSTTKCVVWNRLYKTAVLNKFESYPNVFDSECVTGEDGLFNDFYYSICKKAVFCKNKLYFWRKRKGSLSHSVFLDKMANYIFKREKFLLAIDKNVYRKTEIYFRASICLNCMEEIRKISMSPNYQNHELCKLIYDKYCENLKYLAKGKMFSAPFRFGTMFTKPIMYLMICKKLKG